LSAILKRLALAWTPTTTRAPADAQHRAPAAIFKLAVGRHGQVVPALNSQPHRIKQAAVVRGAVDPVRIGFEIGVRQAKIGAQALLKGNNALRGRMGLS